MISVSHACTHCCSNSPLRAAEVPPFLQEALLAPLVCTTLSLPGDLKCHTPALARTLSCLGLYSSLNSSITHHPPGVVLWRRSRVPPSPPCWQPCPGRAQRGSEAAGWGNMQWGVTGVAQRPGSGCVPQSSGCREAAKEGHGQQ